jgi:hypothetical protein
MLARPRRSLASIPPHLTPGASSALSRVVRGRVEDVTVAVDGTGESLPVWIRLGLLARVVNARGFVSFVAGNPLGETRDYTGDGMRVYTFACRPAP